MHRITILALVLMVVPCWADTSQIRQLYERILSPSPNQAVPKPEDLMGRLGPDLIEALSPEEIASVLPLAGKCLHSSNYDVERDGMVLLMAVALRFDSATLLDPYVDELAAIMSDPRSQANVFAATILAITRPSLSPKVIATFANHLGDASNSASVTATLAGGLLRSSVANDPISVHHVLSIVQKRNESLLTSAIVRELGLQGIKNAEALAFIGKTLDSTDPAIREAALDSVTRLDRENRARFAAQLGRIAADPRESDTRRSQAARALR